MYKTFTKRLFIALFSSLYLFSCGDANQSSTEESDEASSPAISLPKDQFGHEEAPKEWWWHTGTLVTEDGRAFGFEINATGMTGTSSTYAFTQIEITDSITKRNYQNVAAYIPRPADWCQYNTDSAWHVTLEKPNNSFVKMTAIDGDPTKMRVVSGFKNTTDGTPCAFDLELIQDGAPLLVWGTGVKKDVDTSGTSPLTRNNYYYSLTKLKASGKIVVDEDTFQVTGLTWMDHEYGAFPDRLEWIFHNAQLDNGVQLSNYTINNEHPILNKPMASKTTLLLEDGTSVFVDSKTTPMEPIFTLDNVDYFMKFRIEINTEELQADLVLSSLLGNQVFIDPGGNNIYEGVSSCKGTFNGKEVKGTSWIEENL